MSNRIVPATYRAVIDDVMTNIRDAFAEFGVDDQVLQTLQNKWEQKVVESNVAEFEPGPPPNATPVVPQQPLHPHPPPPANQYTLAVPQQRPPAGYPNPSAPSPVPLYGSAGSVKAEQHDSPYNLPALPSPAPPPQGAHRPPMMLGPNGLPQPTYNPAAPYLMHNPAALPQHFQMYANAQPAGLRQPQPPQQQQQQQKPTPADLQRAAQAASRLPQVDGPSPFTLDANTTSSSSGTSRPAIPQVDGPSSVSSSSSSRSSASPPPQLATSHTLPPPPTASGSGVRAGEEEIGSDLDDDDSEVDDDEAAGGAAADGSGPGDIVYCTYDKVQRVKTKWKCVLKDGIVSVGGKDYLFSKCTGEFEW
ncbi:hypothetical protein FS837_009901 [Tulasnella sp. UAMH 9824]|nr:hypothetical protein FS837_009901 [Tulasnella sp. UAMH 9824]